jgi:hypothetical protein
MASTREVTRYRGSTSEGGREGRFLDIYGHLGRGDAGTYPSRQRWFLPVPPTLLRSYRCAVSRNERHCAASAPHSDEMKGDASPPLIHTTPAPTR